MCEDEVKKLKEEIHRLEIEILKRDAIIQKLEEEIDSYILSIDLLKRKLRRHIRSRKNTLI